MADPTLFSSNAQPTFVAEVSSNHHANIERCLQFIDVAHRTGNHGVKFQLFRIDELFTQEILRQSSEHRARKQWELPIDFIPELSRHTRDLGMLFACTPFYIGAVEKLEPYVDFYKVASYELLWDDLLHACAKTGKPVVLSTGMATIDEIAHAKDVVLSAGCEDFTLLHCVSSYPTPRTQMNLKAIDTMREAFQLPVGLSDHSVDPGVIYRAVHGYQVPMVEYHLDLDGEGEEFDAGHCWLPDQIEAVIATVKAGIEADGDGIKEPQEFELADRNWRADPKDGLRPLTAIRSGGDEA